MAVWPYYTAAWQRLRQAKLWSAPLCQVCLLRGKLIDATTVDHNIAIEAGGPPFPSLDGLTSMCASCHSIKTNAKDRAGGSGIAFKGCDVHGRPIDPAHPWHGVTPSKDQELVDEDQCGTRARTKFPEQ